MAVPRVSFPIAEGVGVFVGVVAWDVLADGHPEVIKATLIAGICSFVWFAFRCIKEKNRNK
jgi:hypothetical protein